MEIFEEKFKPFLWGSFNVSDLNPPLPKGKKSGPLGCQEFIFLTVFMGHSCLH